jgi:hypothetical protein
MDLLNELSWGHLRRGSTNSILTSATLVWRPPVRTSGHSEIVVINVAMKNSNQAMTRLSIWDTGLISVDLGSHPQETLLWQTPNTSKSS